MTWIINILNLGLAVLLCFVCTKTDLREGLIYNRKLKIFLYISFVTNIIIYGILQKELFNQFIFNFVFILFISLLLFYSHSIAGGDCKMIIVLSFLYPAQFYVEFGESNITLFWAIGFAILVAYIFLVISSVKGALKNRDKFNSSYIYKSIKTFISSFFLSYSCLFLVNFIVGLFLKSNSYLNIWILRLTCLLAAWCVGKYKVYRKKILILIILLLDATILVAVPEMKISFNIENSLLIIMLFLAQLVIKPEIYEDIEINNISKGMILSMGSTLVMQSSITKGLPRISTEDLKSRLTEEEVKSIKIWAKATHMEKLVIVKKMPFAIFISIGYLIYFVIWGVLTWV